ncbi:hypothetical protein NEHOM01_1738 [Nematocida homosporus]|uniref:uncharacterized protein n=1 Tax=Nematocida homosporus TaxID=1912981 RepID=UPI00221FF491|nr:uncharacterized protein NEHOM01_1738 [Nematocida homosporus]KAI5186843.1 hypothetical protein NEHOM01_1738 [Nematocida homosporus]
MFPYQELINHSVTITYHNLQISGILISIDSYLNTVIKTPTQTIFIRGDKITAITELPNPK